MIVLIAVASLLAALVAALVLRWAVKAISLRLAPAEAYYFSGIALAFVLAVTPSLSFSSRSHAFGQVMSETEAFSSAFPWILLVLGIYPWLARLVAMERFNLPIMFAIAAVATVVLGYGMHFDAWTTITYGTATVGLLLVQAALASVHWAATQRSHRQSGARSD